MSEPDGYRDAYEQTSFLLVTVQGLVKALEIAINDHPHLLDSGHGTSAVRALETAIDGMLDKAMHLREAEWALIVRPQARAGAEHSAGFERGR